MNTAVFSWGGLKDALSDAMSPNTMVKIKVYDSKAVMRIYTNWGTRSEAYHQRLLSTDWNIVETIENIIA